MLRWCLLLGVAIAFLCAGPAASQSLRASIRVEPISSRSDEPVHIRITGLPPRKIVTVRLLATDGHGKRWHSAARFRSDRRGRLDLDRSRALSGSYRGVWGMGLIGRLTTKASLFYPFYWADREMFRLSVRRGLATLGATRFPRTVSPAPLATREETVAGSGFYGRFYAPAAPTGRTTGILVFGGSEGGLFVGLLAETLAARGYPTLGLAYFNGPGLPPQLSRIPLEYFAKALTWLHGQPQVDPAHVAVIGISRGSEAALLLGVHYPDLVQAVVASVPSNVALCGFPECIGPAWTIGGQGVPYTTQFDNPNPTDNPQAVIPVERIRGPVFLDCGSLDLVWSSCPYAGAIMSRLDAAHDPYAHVLYAYSRAGHFVGSLLPYEPYVSPTLVADERAREKLWPRLLAFLSDLSGARR